MHAVTRLPDHRIGPLCLAMLFTVALVACAPAEPPGSSLKPPQLESNAQCPNVNIVEPNSEQGQAVLRDLSVEIASHQASDVQTAWPIAYDSVLPILASSDWVIVQASFDSHLEPAIFLLYYDRFH